jgi:hypothetical protein
MSGKDVSDDCVAGLASSLLSTSHATVMKGSWSSEQGREVAQWKMWDEHVKFTDHTMVVNSGS